MAKPDEPTDSNPENTPPALDYEIPRRPIGSTTFDPNALGCCTMLGAVLQIPWMIIVVLWNRFLSDPQVRWLSGAPAAIVFLPVVVALVLGAISIWRFGRNRRNQLAVVGFCMALVEVAAFVMAGLWHF